MEVGDYVVVISVVNSEQASFGVNSLMRSMVGDTFTIEAVHDKNTFRVNGWLWDGNDLEPLEKST